MTDRPVHFVALRSGESTKLNHRNWNLIDVVIELAPVVLHSERAFVVLHAAVVKISAEGKLIAVGTIGDVVVDGCKFRLGSGRSKPVKQIPVVLKAGDVVSVGITSSAADVVIAPDEVTVGLMFEEAWTG